MSRSGTAQTISEGVPVKRIGILAAAAALLTAIAASGAQHAPLTLVRGAERLEMSLEDLRALPQVTVVTETEFTDGRVAYRGPLAREVLDQLALMSFDTLRLTAANDYYVDVPTQDFRDYDVIFAMEADGVPLVRREKGPLWLMYPISDHEELRDPIYIHRLIWQVERIEPS